MPGMPLQVICYERADDIGFGVSGVVTRARGIRASFPDFNPADVPMATPVTSEKLVYLLDPIGASRRSLALRAGDRVLRTLHRAKFDAYELPYVPPFLHKGDGFVLSIGQFNQWVGSQLMASGTVQIWPGTPAGEALIEDGAVKGVRLLDQGVDRKGQPEAAFTPGMEIRAALTVLADGPGRSDQPRHRRAAGHAVWRRRARVGAGHEVRRRASFRCRVEARHRAAHLRLSRAGDLWLPLRASRRRGVGRNLRALVVRLPHAHRLSLPAALHSAPIPVALSRRRAAALLGSEVAGGVGQARRAIACRQRLRAHRRMLRQHECSHRLRRGRSLDDGNATGRSGAGVVAIRPSRLPARISLRRTNCAAAQAGSKKKRASPRSRATDFVRG